MSSRGGIRATVILGAFVVVVAGAGSYGWLAVSAPSRPASAAVPSAMPSPAAEASNAAGAHDSGAPPASSGDDQERLDALTSLVPAGLATSCTPIGTGGPPASSTVAALLCLRGGNTIVYEALADLDATRGAFASLVSDSGVGPGSGGCWDGSPGVVDYTYGQVACWTDTAGEQGTIAWTYEPANVVATLSGTGGLRAMVNWWWFRALLQPATGSGGLVPEEEALMELLPAGLRGSCDHYDPLQDPSGYKPVGSLGSIDCFPKGTRVADVGFFQFTTAEALGTWYDYRVDQAGVEAGSGGCLDGARGETAWEHGRILCFVTTGGKAAIRWTDDRHQLYGALNATGRDLPALVKWWTSQHLP